MSFSYEERVLKEGLYVAKTGATVRQTAKEFGISKSCIHKDLTQKLPTLNKQLFLKVKKVLKTNFCEKHLRGGIATKNKYKKVAPKTPKGS